MAAQNDLGKAEGAPLTWKVAGASIAGFSHQAESIPCQDAHAATVLASGWFIGVVSDGAGSAARSAIGSRSLCDEVLAYLGARLRDTECSGNDHVDEAVIREWVIDAVERLRIRLGRPDATDGCEISDFHATLIGVVAGARGGTFFHIGDGAACATCSNFFRCVVSLPENGEYANETYFFTQDDWKKHLRTTTFGCEYDIVALMSDGVTPFALTGSVSALSIPFFEPLNQFLANNSRAEGERALTTLLLRDAIRRITGDDKTILWALRINANGPLLHR